MHPGCTQVHEIRIWDRRAGSARVSRAMSFGIADAVGFAGGTPAVPGPFSEQHIVVSPRVGGSLSRIRGWMNHEEVARVVDDYLI